MEIEEKMMEERIVSNPMNLVRAAYFAGVHDGIGKGCEISGIKLSGDDMFDGFMKSVEKSGLGNEVVRCRDCEHYDGECGCTLLDFAMSRGIEDGFCAWGERRDNADE